LLLYNRIVEFKFVSNLYNLNNKKLTILRSRQSIDKKNKKKQIAFIY